MWTFFSRSSFFSRPGASLLAAILAPLWAGWIASAWSADPSASANEDLGFVSTLALSPDGETLAFSWRGDLWTVPAEGGAASRLTSHPALDDAPVWSHDGELIAFSSARPGHRDVFVMDRLGRNVRRLSHWDDEEVPESFFPDGERLLIASTKGENLDRSFAFEVQLLSGSAAVSPYEVRGRHPALSRDGKAIAFTRGLSPWQRRGYWGSANVDIWVWEIGSSAAERLTESPGRDGYPQWIDEETLYFLSDRSGSLNVWSMPADAGGKAAQQLTFQTGEDIRVFSADKDGRVLVYALGNALYRADAPDFRPRKLAISAGDDRVEGPIFREIKTDGARSIAPAPDGSEMAVEIRGEIFIVPTEPERPTVSVASSPFRDQMPAWSPDGRTLYFVSDREDGREQIYSAEPIFSFEEEKTSAEAEEAESSEAASVSQDQPAADLGANDAEISLAQKRVESLGDRVIALETELEAARASLERLRKSRESAPEIQETPSFRGLWEQTHNLRLSRAEFQNDPDMAKRLDEQIASHEKLLAELIENRLADLETQVSLLNARRQETQKQFGEAAQRLAKLKSPATASDAEKPKASEDSSHKEEEKRKPFWRALDFTVRRVTQSDAPEFRPAASPDGTRLAFVRGLGDLMVRDLATDEEKKLAFGWNLGEFEWSPDGRWIAFDRRDQAENSEVWIVPADGSSAPQNVSRHPDYDQSPRWSGDGKILAFASRRTGKSLGLHFVFLDKTLEQASALELKEYFAEAGEKYADHLKTMDAKIREARRARSGESAAEKPASSEPEKKAEKEEEAGFEIDFENLHRRVRCAAELPGDAEHFALSADGASYLFVYRDGLATTRWDGTGFKTLDLPAKGESLRLVRDGSRVFYLAMPPPGLPKPMGAPASLTPQGEDPKTYFMGASLVIDLDAERAQKYDDALRTLAREFYDPAMHGADWPAVAQRYRPALLGTRSAAEFSEAFEWVVGELNSSHLGIGTPQNPKPIIETIGRLGVELDPDHKGPGERIASVVPDGPADREASRLQPGETILAVNSQPLEGGANLHALLSGMANRPVVLTVGSKDDAQKTRRVSIIPADALTLKKLEYRALIDHRRRRVEEWSEGRLGYCHIPVMFQPDVEEFERELVASAQGKEGLVVDVRDNRGGFTADWLLQIFFAPEHARTISRGSSEADYPQDRRMRPAWTRPAILLCNERSYSNAEIFAHAWKTLGRGKVVGQPTFGGVISTGSTEMIDGSSLRLPGRGWYLPDGRNMEGHGAQPDILVEESSIDALHGDDPQLRRAVEELLQEVSADDPDAPKPFWGRFWGWKLPERR